LELPNGGPSVIVLVIEAIRKWVYGWGRIREPNRVVP